MGNDRQALEEYETHRQALFKQLLNLTADVTAIDTKHRDAVEMTLRQVICRTERLIVSEDHDAMTEDKLHNQPVAMTVADIANFVATDSVVQTLNRTIEQSSQQLHSPVEFCKSAPFPLSFLDDYKLKRVLEANKDDPDVQSSLKDNPAAWLNHKTISSYSMVVGRSNSDFANARLTQLVDEALCNNASCLLWVPPSLPYYPLSGAYADSAGFSKTLVFSAWLMVPRMLASLISYEVERRTIGNPASVDPQKEEPRLYFTPDKKRHPVPQLVYRMEGGEPSNMTNFTLLYPSLTLAGLFDPVAARLSGKTQTAIEDALQAQVAALVEKLRLRRYEQADGEPDRWYWAGPVLLDKLSDDHSSIAGKWLHSDDVGRTSFSTDEDAGDTSKGQHFEQLVQAFDSPRRIGLGPMPGDFPRVMAEMALGSPAITALRSFRRLYRGKASAKCVSALSVANEFVNLFNKPESVAAVRIAVRDRVQYWRKVLRYCRDGCLEAVLDEYLHLLKAECETLTQAEERLNASVNIRTARLKVDDLKSFLEDKPRNMRCHFAVDFGNQRIETEEGSRRVANIRHNFNSPFRPFLLATTSIGQEGLDFHQYCRKVVHWNLPSNPIDLEQREGRINRFKGLVIRQQVAHKYGPLLTAADVQSKDPWNDLFRIAELMERDGKPCCQLVPFWHVETREAKQFKIERIIPFYPFSRDRAKLSSILRTLAIYRLAFGQPRQSELIEHLLKHLPKDKIGAVREKLMVNLSPISYRRNGSAGEPNEGIVRFVLWQRAIAGNRRRPHHNRNSAAK